MAILITASSAWAESTIVGVNGMVCSMCAQGIKKNFSVIKEITKIDVDLDNKLVTFESKAKLDDDVIRKTMKQAGYDVTSIKHQ